MPAEHIYYTTGRDALSIRACPSKKDFCIFHNYKTGILYKFAS